MVEWRAVLTKIEKKRLLELSKTFFVEKIVTSHLRNTRKLTDPREFNINPLLRPYVARVLTGKTDCRSLAKAMLLPRVLGTSITTSFGYYMQRFCGDVLQKGFGSSVSGIDLEFVDAVDGRKKYCQVKSGPETINVDDIDTIQKKFDAIKNLARTNSVKNLQLTDLCVGVLYGEHRDLNSRYVALEIERHIPVFTGKEFWRRLTGDADFYSELAQAFAESVENIDFAKELDIIADKLAIELAKTN